MNQLIFNERRIRLFLAQYNYTEQQIKKSYVFKGVPNTFLKRMKKKNNIN